MGYGQCRLQLPHSAQFPGGWWNWNRASLLLSSLTARSVWWEKQPLDRLGDPAKTMARTQSDCLDLGDREGFPARSGLKASRRSLVAMSQAGGVTGAQSEPERQSSGEELRDEQVPCRGRCAGWGGVGGSQHQGALHRWESEAPRPTPSQPRFCCDLCPTAEPYWPSGTLQKPPAAHQPPPRMWQKEGVPSFPKHAQAAAAPTAPRAYFVAQRQSLRPLMTSGNRKVNPTGSWPQ